MHRMTLRLGRQGVKFGGGSSRLPTLEDYITLLGPSLWYQADKGDIAALANAAAVATWDGQDAVGIDVRQTTESLRPIYYTAGGPNSLPCVTFVGSSTHSLAISTVLGSSILSAAQGSTFIVCNHDGAAGAFLRWTASTNGNYTAKTDGTKINSINANATLSVNYPTGWAGNWHLLEIHREVDNVCNIVVDGVTQTSPGSFVINVDTSVTGAVYLGRSSSTYLTGSLYLVAHFKTALSASQRSTLRRILEGRTGINCSPFDFSLSSPGEVQIYQRDGSNQADIVVTGAVL